MLNIEYYKDKLVELGVIDPDRLAVISEQLQVCEAVHCCECLFNPYGSLCSVDALNWLFSEYKKPKVDWSKVKVDTPILVKDTEEGEWRKRHFARFKNGKVYAWHDGLTSWSAIGECEHGWKYAKLAESEE